MVAGSVGAGDSGAVEHEGHALAVEGDVHEHLVEGAGEERGVDAHDRVESAIGQTGGGGDSVLFGDADVEDAVWEFLGEFRQSHGQEHGRGDGDNVLALFGEFADLGAEDGGP